MKKRNPLSFDIVKALLAVTGVGILICAIVFLASAVSNRPNRPGHITCYSINGTKVLDVQSPDVIWHNTNGVTYMDQEWRRVEFSNENCMVTYNQP